MNIMARSRQARCKRMPKSSQLLCKLQAESKEEKRRERGREEERERAWRGREVGEEGRPGVVNSDTPLPTRPLSPNPSYLVPTGNHILKYMSLWEPLSLKPPHRVPPVCFFFFCTWQCWYLLQVEFPTIWNGQSFVSYRTYLCTFGRDTTDSNMHHFFLKFI